ncbi:hypothetical protein B5F37_10360 [Drancourtella sp. An210]|nr:DUF4358 domain-containing protein [uncultured Sellimonas sp.]OUP00720.1 hypothetical protein B5F37_10360 [Drancourtella sp. An210]OUP63642.1 hypothetical protein B5F13_10045 [Drancourtella sp. An177]
MKRKEDIRGTLMKAGFVIVIVVYLAMLCMRGYAKDVPIEKIKEAVENAGIPEGVQELKDRDLRRYYGIDGSQNKEYFFYKADSSMNVDEVLVIKARNSEEVSSYEAAVKTHLENQKKSFEGYGVTQTALLKKAYAQAEGSYVIYMAGENADKWKSAFEKAVK